MPLQHDLSSSKTLAGTAVSDRHILEQLRRSRQTFRRSNG
jgi:hypothetical protein